MSKFTENCSGLKNFQLVLAYDGSKYAGWQRQPITAGKPSLQGTIEDVLSAYLNEDILLIGSGRTDAGVHALGQVANFYSSSNLPADEIKRNVNTLLPDDIKILQAKIVERHFHSRYWARAKTYEYRIAQGEVQSVFTRKYTYYVAEYLNLAAMEKAAGFLTGTHDFKSFSTDRKDGKSTVRTIEEIKIYTCKNPGINPGFEIRISITGNGFLYNMVRIIVGTLIEVGQGIRRPEDIKDILKAKDRNAAGQTVSPNGLFLMNVRY
ncbi:MAG: tRNA pseudouridine synthase A [Lachnoclostridium sp.]